MALGPNERRDTGYIRDSEGRLIAVAGGSGNRGGWQ